jgi:hypothetical protein
MANCMIQSKGLSLKYMESINCANYIVNHTPINALKNITLEEAWTNNKLDVSHFHVFGIVVWAHIPDEKRKALQAKSEKCIFFGYSEDVKGYKILQSHSNEIIIRRDVKFDEIILACEPNLEFAPSSTYDPSSAFVPSLDRDPSSVFVPSFPCDPSSVFVPSFFPILVSSSSHDDNEDENPLPPAHLLLDESIEHEPKPTPSLLIWVRSTQEVVGDLTSDPLDQCQTCSQFQRASSILDQVSKTRDPKAFVEASSHLD